MAEEAGERSEAPTQKRIDDARKRGEVAQSRDLAAVVTLGAGVLALFGFPIAGLAASLRAQAGAAWGGAQRLPETAEDFRALFAHAGAETGQALLPFALVLFGVGTLVSLTQTGALFSPQAFAFRANRMSPAQGLKRIFSRDRVLDLAKAPLKVAIVLFALGAALHEALPHLLALFGTPIQSSFAALRALSGSFAQTAFSGLLLIGLLDLAWVRLRYHERLKMTPREVRDELKEREGSPQIRGRRRALQRELSRQRMLAEVARADAVVTNPTHYSIALRYDRAQMAAPMVVARGRGELALRIRREARAHGVPIVENPPLARVLYGAGRVGREVPEQLFQAVAEVLAFVYRMDHRRGERWSVSR